MWKYILYYCIFIAICFFVPCFFVSFEKSDIDENINKEIKEDNIVQNKDIIKLLLTETNEVIEVPIDDYLKGVLLRRNANRF